MAIFVRTALQNLDNRAAYAKHRSPNWPSRVLYVNSFSQYSVPTSKTLTAELLDRLQLGQLLREYTESTGGSDWSTPISLEQMASLQPDCIVVSCPAEQKQPTIDKLINERALRSATAIKRQHVIAVDGEIQSSPSQFLVLAYYDLVSGLESMTQDK